MCCYHETITNLSSLLLHSTAYQMVMYGIWFGEKSKYSTHTVLPFNKMFNKSAFNICPFVSIVSERILWILSARRTRVSHISHHPPSRGTVFFQHWSCGDTLWRWHQVCRYSHVKYIANYHVHLWPLFSVRDLGAQSLFYFRSLMGLFLSVTLWPYLANLWPILGHQSSCWQSEWSCNLTDPSINSKQSLK